LATRSRAAELLPLVPAAAIPLLFLHRTYQAHASIGRRRLHVRPRGRGGRRRSTRGGRPLGLRALRRALPLWIVAGAFLGLFSSSVFWTPLELTTSTSSPRRRSSVAPPLAPALVLLLRRAVDVDRFLWAFVAWVIAASVWGLLQFLGS
jgi:hypothetical protein